MIASHYAEPLERRLSRAAPFFDQPNGIELAALAEGDALRMLDNSRGWAWGYGPDGRVGYVTADALAA